MLDILFTQAIPNTWNQLNPVQNFAIIAAFCMFAGLWFSSLRTIFWYVLAMFLYWLHVGFVSLVLERFAIAESHTVFALGFALFDIAVCYHVFTKTKKNTFSPSRTNTQVKTVRKKSAPRQMAIIEKPMARKYNTCMAKQLSKITDHAKQLQTNKKM